MKFLIGVIGAAVLATIAWLIVGLLDVEIGLLTHSIIGIVAFSGFAIGQVIYDKAKKEK